MDDKNILENSSLEDNLLNKDNLILNNVKMEPIYLININDIREEINDYDSINLNEVNTLLNLKSIHHEIKIEDYSESECDLRNESDGTLKEHTNVDHIMCTSEKVSKCNTRFKTVSQPENKNKRERSANFANNEVLLLFQIVLKYSTTVESKKTDAAMWKEKEDCWKTIESEFNAVLGEPFRSWKVLRHKYEVSKSKLKKKISNNLQEVEKTDGGEPVIIPYTDCEKILLKILNKSETVLGGRFDDDENSEEGSLIETRKEKHEETQPIVDNAVDTVITPTSQVVSPLTPMEISWQKWSPRKLKRKPSSPLKATAKRLLERLNTGSKDVELLKIEILKEEQIFKREENERNKQEQLLRIKSLNLDIENKEKDLELKNLELQIKKQQLQNLINK